MVHDLNNGQVDFPYEWVTTKDNSLTLKMIAEKTEWMHSLHGAYSESQFIYGDALKLALERFDRTKTLHVMSMGLGLGYLELITAFECLTHSQPFKVTSFELDPLLKNLFIANLKLASDLMSAAPNPELALNHKNQFKIEATEFQNFYLEFFINQYGLSVVQQGLNLLLKGEISTSFHNQSLELKNALTPEELKITSDPFHLVFYDAFSSNVQSELWSEEFLTAFLEKKTDPNFCVLSTYAKVGALTRALKHNGFTLENKKGYAYKRESTLAIKEKK